MNSESFCLQWSRDPLSALYRRAIGGSAKVEGVYVESLDGDDDERSVLRLLVNWNLVDASSPIPLVTDLDKFADCLNNDEFFPGYDTIWLVHSCDLLIQPSTFITWYATGHFGALPKEKRSSETLVDWTPVISWMQGAHAAFGISQGDYKLFIELQNH